jgi:hypothetical protein
VKAALIGARQIAVQHCPCPIGLPVANVFRSATKVLSILIAREFESRFRRLRFENRKLRETAALDPSIRLPAVPGADLPSGDVRRSGALRPNGARAASNWRPNGLFDCSCPLSNIHGSRILGPEGRFDPKHARHRARE